MYVGTRKPLGIYVCAMLNTCVNRCSKVPTQAVRAERAGEGREKRRCTVAGMEEISYCEDGKGR